MVYFRNTIDKFSSCCQDLKFQTSLRFFSKYDIGDTTLGKVNLIALMTDCDMLKYAGQVGNKETTITTLQEFKIITRVCYVYFSNYIFRRGMSGRMKNSS